MSLLLELKLELLLLLFCLFFLLELLALDLVVVVRDRVDVEGLRLVVMLLLVIGVVRALLLDADLLAILANALLGGVASALADEHQLLLTANSWCERAAWQAAGLVVAGERVVHIVDVWLGTSLLRGCGHGLLLMHL